MSKLILFNKPFQVLSQFSSDQGKSSLKDFLDNPECKDCYPAGRLDYDSEGLLLLTDDGKLQHRIAHPSRKLAKQYWVQVEGQPSQAAIAQLGKGVMLKDGPSKAAKARLIQPPTIWPRSPPIRQRQQQTTCWLEITLHEGRNRQVRRMCAAIGHPCLRLVRFQIGNWTLEGLAPGSYRIQQVHLANNSTQKKSWKTKAQR